MYAAFGTINLVAYLLIFGFIIRNKLWETKAQRLLIQLFAAGVITDIGAILYYPWIYIPLTDGALCAITGFITNFGDLAYTLTQYSLIVYIILKGLVDMDHALFEFLVVLLSFGLSFSLSASGFGATTRTTTIYGPIESTWCWITFPPSRTTIHNLWVYVAMLGNCIVVPLITIRFAYCWRHDKLEQLKRLKVVMPIVPYLVIYIIFAMPNMAIWASTTLSDREWNSSTNSEVVMLCSGLATLFTLLIQRRSHLRNMICPRHPFLFSEESESERSKKENVQQV
eukprot:TRINITY_DN3263_c0_g1_i3.p1 TRINITY_DN3263_c0_g1~~TRINITY_DN3263_c0_g1_i3.p1  ORF type:complete len:331 (-),score=15.18 TRINITY_DN3263_c0_g1_i3:36-884(-)